MPSTSIAPSLGSYKAAEELGQRRFAGAVLSDDRQRCAGRNCQVEAFQNVRVAGGEPKVRLRKRISRAGRPLAVRAARRKISSRFPSPAPTAGRRHGRGGTVQRPVETSEGDHRHADRALGKHHQATQIELTVYRRGGGCNQKTKTFAPTTKKHAPQHGPLAECVACVLQLIRAACGG